MTTTDMKSADLSSALNERIRGARRRLAAGDGRTPAAGVADRLSEQQQWIWTADQVAGGSAAYNVPEAWRLRGQVDAGLLAESLRQLVERHRILRTVYRARDGVVRPVLLDPAEVRLISRAPGPSDPASARRIATGLAARPFDLATEAPIRLALLPAGEGEWLLVAVLHHIAVDAWSMSLFWRELADAGAALSSGPVPPASPARQYAEFVNRRSAPGATAARDADLGYWRERLSGLQPLDLPTDFPRPAVRSGLGRRYSFAVPPGLGEALRAYAADSGVTTFPVLLAGFSAVLSRWSGHQDVAVGTPLAMRAEAGLDEVIGLFVNTNVVRSAVHDDLPFRDLVGQIRQHVLQAYDHQSLPFTAVVEDLQPRRDASHNPLVDVMFTLQSEPEPIGWPGVIAEPWPVDSATSKLDLALTMTEAESGGLAGTVEYDTALYGEPTVRRIVDHYLRLLADGLDHPERPVGELAVLSVAETRTLTVERNPAPRAYPSDQTVPDLIAEVAARQSDAEAICGLGGAMTYGELMAAADGVAARLLARGTGPESPVAVCLDRSSALVVALLGVLRAGGCYVPVDPTYPAERIGHILRDSGAALLLTGGRAAESFDLPEGVTLLDVESPAPAGTVARGVTTPDNLAYIIYTSGSTGRPKGVMVPHRGMLNLFASMSRELPMTAGDRVGAIASAAFDMSVPELLLPLLAGATVVLLPKSVSMDPDALSATIKAERLSIMQATPTTWQMLLDTGWAGADLSAVAGAEAVPAVLAAQLACRVRRLFNYYGPTETTVWSVADRIGKVAEERPLPIGTPIDNTTVYLLDQRGRLVPDGAVGEICIGGAGVTRGYRGAPALTGERFVPDPYGCGQRLYRTADLGRWLSDGRLEYLGRTDNQVKVRGHRIELPEVEAVLGAHPDVGQAVVTVFGADGDRRLVGYVVGSRPGLDVTELRKHLRSTLPEFMVPSTLVKMRTLPLNANGKIDRAALPEPDGPVASDRVEPETETQRAVAEVWCDVLGIPAIGIHDDFFAAGAHSLHAIRAVSRLRDRLGVDLPIERVFTHPTVAEFAGEVEDDSPSPGGTRRAIVASADRTPAPLSYAQRQLWFLEQLHGGRGDLNVATVLRLTGAVDEDTLRAAIGDVLTRHDVLRSHFEMRGAESVQLVDAVADVLTVTDFRHHVPLDAVEEGRRLAKQDIDEPFDLGRGPLLRARLIRTGPADQLLVLVVHHAVMDGWSWRVLRTDLHRAYGARLEGGNPLVRPAVQYADYARWQQGEPTAAQEADLAFWRERLAGAPAGELPCDRPRPAVWSGAGDEVTIAFSAAESALIRSFSRDRGATVFMTLLAAFQHLAARWAHDDDTVIGTPVVGRDDPTLDDLIGCFINFVVLRTNVGAASTFADLVDRTRKDTLAAMGRQSVPFGRLVEELQPERDASRNPFFQLMLTVEDAEVGLLELPGTVSSTLRLPDSVAKFDLAVSVTDDGLEMPVRFTYATDLFDRATVERIASTYRRLVAAVLAEPDRPLAGFGLPGSDRMLDTRSGEATKAAEVSLHELVADQARSTPDAVALQGRDRTYSYEQLWRRSAAMARGLVERGVRRGDVVGVVLPRSPDTVVLLLGVLTAGAAYVACDPGHSAARTAAVLGHSGARHTVTSASRATDLRAAGVAGVVDVADVHAIGPEPDGSGLDLPVCIGSDDLAAIFYTSGSTGEPKGIATTHRGPVNYMRYLAEATGVHGGDTVLQVAGLAFDASVREIFGTLTHGGRLVMLTDDEAKDPYAILRAVREHRVTALLSLVPSMLSALRVAVGEDHDGSSLRIALVGGEVIHERHLRDAAVIGPDMRLINHYGPTECTMTSTWHPVTEGTGAIPIGRPIPGARVRLIDQTGHPVPDGALGELFIATPGLARGYAGAPALTARHFVPDPYGPPGSRMYCTGDLVRRRDDGELTFHGRADNQIKLRGIRIEPGEIEAALTACDGVYAAAVTACGEGLARELAAWLVLDGSRTDSRRVRQQLVATLPRHLVPAWFTVVDRLPVTPTGKTDRRRLTAMPVGERAAEVVQTARDSVELRMTGLWEQLLGRGPISPSDDFFAVGGHSLKAVELVDAVARQFGRTLPLSAVFTNPTVESMCGLLSDYGAAPTTLIVPLVTGRGTGTPLFLVHPQGGDVCCYAHLARILGAERDVCGIEADGLNGDTEPLEAVEAMADRYLAELSKEHTGGRWALGGWSFGGNVAYEMARRLEAEGETVEFLGVIDARVFGRDRVESWYDQVGERERFRLGAEFGAGALEGTDDREFFELLLRDARALGRVGARADSQTIRRMMRVFTANATAADRYLVQDPVAVDIDLFKARDRHPSLPNPSVRPDHWQDRTRGVLRTVELPGNHHNLVQQPNVQALGESLRHALARAARNGGRVIVA